MSTNYTDIALPLPITEQERQIADRFGQEIPAKTEQIQLNTIAVLVVRNYLQLMGITTDLSQSDSWNPIGRLSADVADLVLPQIGRLECRAIAVGSLYCSVPPEVWHDRIGYVVVEIDAARQTARLLGFVAAVETEQLDLNQLQPIEVLLEHLDQLRSQSPIVQLSRWIEGIFAPQWEAVEAVLSPLELGVSFRGDAALTTPAIQRAKQINLGIQLPQSAIALVVELTSLTPQVSEIRLRVYPLRQTVLPPLQLTVLDRTGAVFLEAQARSQDNYLQLRFQGEVGEQFAVSIKLEATRVIEQFMI